MGGRIPARSVTTSLSFGSALFPTLEIGAFPLLIIFLGLGADAFAAGLAATFLTGVFFAGVFLTKAAFFAAGASFFPANFFGAGFSLVGAIFALPAAFLG